MIPKAKTLTNLALISGGYLAGNYIHGRVAAGSEMSQPVRDWGLPAGMLIGGQMARKINPGLGTGLQVAAVTRILGRFVL